MDWTYTRRPISNKEPTTINNWMVKIEFLSCKEGKLKPNEVIVLGGSSVDFLDASTAQVYWNGSPVEVVTKP